MRKDCMEISVIVRYGPTVIADSVRLRTPDGEGYAPKQASDVLRDGGGMVVNRMANMLDALFADQSDE